MAIAQRNLTGTPQGSTPTQPHTQTVAAPAQGRPPLARQTSQGDDCLSQPPAIRLSERASINTDQDEGDLSPESTLNDALDTQQQIYRELSDESPTNFLHTLPENNILVAQFRKDPEGTYNLLSDRLDALHEDIKESFSRYGRQSSALSLHAQLDKQLARLSDLMDEDSLTALLKGLKNYEETFSKDSWLQLANIAFIGVPELLKSPFASPLQKLVDPQRLKLGNRELLDPGKVKKYNVGYVTSNRTGLASFIEGMVTKEGNQSLEARRQLHLALLQDQDLPSTQAVTHPTHVLKHLLNTRPKLVLELLKLNIEARTYTKEPQVRAKAEKQLKALSVCDPTPESLHALLDKDTVLADTTSQQLLTQFLLRLTTSLEQTTEQLLGADTPPDNATMSGLSDDYETARSIAGHLKHQPCKDRLIHVLQNSHRLAARPVYTAIHTEDGQGLWQLPYKPSLDQVEDALAKLSLDAEDQRHESLIQKLSSFLRLPPSQNLKDVRQKQGLKDELFTLQQELCIEQTRKHIKDPEQFQEWLARARNLEVSRPSHQLINEKMTLLERVTRAGRATLSAQRTPFEHQARALLLEHELALSGYNFKEEVGKLIMTMPNLYKSMKNASGEAYQSSKALISDYKSGKLSMMALLNQFSNLAAENRDALTNQLRDTLTGAAAIGQVSPRTLRALYGNTAQTMNVLCNTVGQNSALYGMYSEFYARVSAETHAQYFLDAVRHNDEHKCLEGLSEEQLAGVKRLYALNQLLACGPYVPTLIDGVLKTATGGLSPLNIIWNGARTGVRLFSSYMTQSQVNAMKPEDLKALNITLDIIHTGPVAACARQQYMARIGQTLGDLASNKLSIKRAVVNSTLLYPFRAVWHELKDAWRDLFRNKPGSRLRALVMTLKAVAVVVPPVMACATLLFAPTIPAALIAIVGIPSALCMSRVIALKAIRYAGLINLGLLAQQKVLELTQGESGIDFDKEAEQLLADNRYQERIQPMVKRHACAALADKYWQEWQQRNEHNARLAKDTDDNSSTEFEKSWQAGNPTFSRLIAVTRALRFMSTLDIAQASQKETLEAIRQHLPEDEQDTMPDGDEIHHLGVWALGVQERLQDELYDATGSDELPQDQNALKAAMKNMMVNTMRGMVLRAEVPKIDRYFDNTCQSLVSDQIMLRTQKRTALCMARSWSEGLQSTMVSRAMTSGKRVGKTMRPDEFAAMLSRDEDLKDTIRKQFADVFTAEMRKASRSGYGRLKNALQKSGKHFSDSEIRELVTTAAGAA